MKVASPNRSRKIDRIEITDDTLTSRGGLALYGQYLENSRFLDRLGNHLAELQKSAKGQSARSLCKQLLCAFADGRGDTMMDFTALRNDPAQASILELDSGEMAGGDMMKRFFRKFNGRRWHLLRPMLHELFLWRMSVEKPSEIVLDIDTMVLDNDDAHRREGCRPTYKKVKGFQNLQLSWQGRLVDVLFRSGEKHSNHGEDVSKVLRKVVGLIRREYDSKVPIIVTMDSGFLDGKLLTFMERELEIGYICSGKLYKSVQQHVESFAEDDFSYYRKGKTRWSYVEFESALDAWKETNRRTIYTSLVEQDGQISLPFSRPDSIYYTNLGRQEKLDKELWNRGRHRLRSAEGIVELAHGRGQSELIHRSLKEFMGREHLPFQRFGMNAAYYLFQVIGHFMLECFRQDVAVDVIPIRSYPNTIRRKVIDFAAKVVRTGGRTILKVARSTWEALDLQSLWRRCKLTPRMT